VLLVEKHSRLNYNKIGKEPIRNDIQSRPKLLRKFPNNQKTTKIYLKHQKSSPLPPKTMLLYACVQPHPNTNNIGRGERGGCHHCSCSFHDCSKITQCLKNYQPFLAAIIACCECIPILQDSWQCTYPPRDFLLCKYRPRAISATSA